MSSKELYIRANTLSSKNTFPSIPKRDLDFILYNLMLQNLRKEELATGKTYRKANPYIVIHYYKSSRVINRMKGAALALHKTQFIKKPKNPI
ncbi:MAG: hypothetical protein ACTHK8_03405 [Ginsengibacter sp.]